MPRLLTFVALASLCSCAPLEFGAEVKGEATIAGSVLGQVLGAFPMVGGFANIDFNQNQDFKNNNADRERIKTMRLTGLTLKITSPSDQDFRFLDSLEFAVKVGDQEQKVAGKTGIDSLPLSAPNPTLGLDLVDVDVASFARSSSMTLISRGSGRQPAKDTTIEVIVRVVVGVGL